MHYTKKKKIQCQRGKFKLKVMCDKFKVFIFIYACLYAASNLQTNFYLFIFILFHNLFMIIPNHVIFFLLEIDFIFTQALVLELVHKAL